MSMDIRLFELADVACLPRMVGTNCGEEFGFGMLNHAGSEISQKLLDKKNVPYQGVALR